LFPSGASTYFLFEVPVESSGTTTSGTIATIRYRVDTDGTVAILNNANLEISGGTPVAPITPVSVPSAPFAVTLFDKDAWIDEHFSAADKVTYATFVNEVASSQANRDWWIWRTSPAYNEWVTFINAVLAIIQAPAPGGWGAPTADFDTAVWVVNNGHW